MIASPLRNWQSKIVFSASLICVMIACCCTLNVTAKGIGDTMYIAYEQTMGLSNASFAMNSMDQQQCNCPQYTGSCGTALDLRIASGYRITLSSEASLDLGLSVGYVYQQQRAELPGDRLPSLDPDGNVIFSTTIHELTHNFSALDALLEVGAQWNGIEASAAYGYGGIVSGYHENAMKLIEPPDAVFDPVLFPDSEVEYRDDGRTLVVSKGDAIFNTTLAPVARFTLGYVVRSSQFEIGFRVAYRMSFEPPITQGAGNYNSLTAGFRIGVLW